MLDAAESHCRSCHTCQIVAGRQTAGIGAGTRESAGIGAYVYMDIGYVGGDEAEEKQFIVLVDQESGLLAAAPLRRRTADDVVGALHAHWVRPFGPPNMLTTDGAREFVSKELRGYAERHGIRLITTSPYNPPANIAESAVKKVKAGLRAAMHDAAYDSTASRLPWTMLLDSTVHNWNTTPSEAVGTTPATLFFGRELRHPSEAVVTPPVPLAGDSGSRPSTDSTSASEWRQDRALDYRAVRSERRATYFDRRLQLLVFPPDTLVTLYRQRPGTSGTDYLRRSGPYRVARRLSETSYQLAHLDGTPLERPVHARWMTPYSLVPEGLRSKTRPPVS